MARLTLAFLDTFQVALESQPITRFRSSKNRGLLVHLALQSDRPVPREVLATLFWPEESESNARNNLRQSIFQLRKVLGDLRNPAEPYLLVTRQTVQFNAESDHALDVNHFLRSIERGELETAVDIYQGDLLPGLTCDSLEFEDWLRYEREQLHQTALEVMFAVTQHHLQTGRLDKAQTVARRQLRLEPWREPAHRQLMRAFALAEDRVSALAQYVACQEILWNELGVKPSAETITLYDSIKVGDYDVYTGDESTESPAEIQNNLPQYATPFIGREEELAALDDLIVDPSVRLVTIVGPGGIGKTRLAIAAAERIQTRGAFPDGLFFIDLAPLQEPGQILQSVVDAMGLPLQGRDSRSSRQLLLKHVRQKKMLLVFDNFEHLLDGAELLADVVEAGPDLKIIATSQERLYLLLEQAFPIQGLPFPDWETKGDVTTYVAGRFFLEFARRNQPHFALQDDNDLADLARICRLVAGMPLALELAASWVDTLSLGEIANELQDGMDILETEMRDLPERQRSVRATFDYSWRNLDEAEQRIFAQLSVFRGGFTRTAAQEVTGVTLQGLSRLVNKSFIRFDNRRGRYEVHELLRQYGGHRLGRLSQLEEATRDLHSDYFCRFMAGYTDALKGKGQSQALDAIEADFENVRLAWDHASTKQNFEAIGMAIESLWRFYWNFGRRDVREFEKAVADLKKGELVGQRGIVLGRLLAPLGRFYASWDRVKARTVLEESLDLLQRLGGFKESLATLLFLAEVQESIAESNRLYQEGLTLAKDIDDRWAIGHALVFWGENDRLMGHYHKAEERYREALSQFRRNGDNGGIAWSLNRLSLLAIDRGRYEDALTLAREAWSTTEEFNPAYHSMGSFVLARAYHALGAYEEAEKEFRYILALSLELEHDPGIHNLCFWLGEIAFGKRDYTGARQQYQNSLAGAVVLNNLDLVIRNHNALGRIDLEQDKSIEAKRHFHTALQTAGPLNRRPLLLDCLTPIAALLAKEGDPEYAALLAMLVTKDPASRAIDIERAQRLLARIETILPSDELDAVRQRSYESDLTAVAAQLSSDLETS
ncbi:MAG: BTAD domain-containing putative transcriptional regulator [Chloroflexota bacterium]|jgi:predicted ATPase/DNA-binding SARP family transcriptional activator